VASPLPQIDLNDPGAVADFVVAHAEVLLVDSGSPLPRSFAG
jgi:hypothetical protein